MASGNSLPATTSGNTIAIPVPRQRAAALVLAIGSGKASAILDHLSPDEVALLAEEVSHLGHFDTMTRNALMADTLNHMLSIDPVAEAQALRDRARAMEVAAEMAHLEVFDPHHPFKFLQKVDLSQAVQFLRNEHPQTAAVILSAQPPELAARILAGFEPTEAGDISLRIATIGRTPPELVHRIEQAIRRRLSEAEVDDTTPRDGPKELAAILNNAERDMEQTVLEHLSEHDRELAERVRSLMFVFEDIATLEDRAIQQVLQQVNTGMLAMALKGVDAVVKETLLRNLSERARESLLEEVDLLGAVRKQDVAEARSGIVAAIRSLETSGQIVIARGDDGELVE